MQRRDSFIQTSSCSVPYCAFAAAWYLSWRRTLCRDEEKNGARADTLTGSVECALHWRSNLESPSTNVKCRADRGWCVPNYSKMADLPARGELFHLQIILAGKMLLLRTLTDALSVWV